MAKSKTVTIYGIKNCDTMKKARAWLESHGVAYAFHDYKTAGIEREKLGLEDKLPAVVTSYLRDIDAQPAHEVGGQTAPPAIPGKGAGTGVRT